MNLEIGPFTIVSDSRQFTLYRKNSIKDPQTKEIKVVDSFCGHYSMLDSCLKDGIIRHGLLQSECFTLSEVLEEIKQLKKWIDDTLNLPKPAMKMTSCFCRTKSKTR